MASAYVIEKLSSSNYLTWCSDVKFLLIERGVWDIVTETEKLPILDEKSVFEADIGKFKQRANLALSIIYLNIDVEFRKIVEEANDPVSAWKKLKDCFCPDARAFHMKVFSDLTECRIQPNETISLFAARLLRLNNQIRSINENFDCTYTSFQLLRYLPREYEGIVRDILRWKEGDFTFNKICSELTAEESRIKLREKDESYVVQVQNIAVKKPISKVKCFRCGLLGHYQSQCFRGESSNLRKPHNSKNFSPVGKPKFSSPNYANRRDVRPRSKTRYQSPSPVRANWDNSSDNRQSRRNRRFNSRKPRGNTNFPKSQVSEDDQCKFSFFVTENSLSGVKESSSWIFDSGASHHFCMNRNLFCEYKTITDGKMAVAVRGITFPIDGVGTVKLRFGQRIIYFENVMHSEKLRRNLISGPMLDKKGASFYGESGEVKISYKGKFLFKAHLKDGVYQLFPRIPVSKNVSFEINSITKADLVTWHRRMGHVSPSIMIHTCKEKGAKGLPFLKNDDSFFCEVCRLNKFRRVSFKPVNTRTHKPLELLYADVWGPSRTLGKNGEKYFLSIIDDFSRKVALYPICQKSNVFEIVKRHITRAENFLGEKVKHFRSDNGGEFVSDNFRTYFSEKGIKHELTNPYTPEQNGIVERFNQTVVNGARTILSDSGLKEDFWPEAMLYFAYTWNRICPRGLNKTPFELYGGSKPSVKHLKPFGVVSYVGIPRQNRTKLEAKAKQGFLVGYAFQTKGYRIWLPDSNKIIETINVAFDENSSRNHWVKGAVLGSKDLEKSQIILPINEDEDNEPLEVTRPPKAVGCHSAPRCLGRRQSGRLEGCSHEYSPHRGCNRC